MMRSRNYILFQLFAILCFKQIAFAQFTARDFDARDEKAERSLLIPYAFSSESLEVAFGLAGGTGGYLQEQMTTFAALLYSSNESGGVYLFLNQYQLPFAERLFLSANFSLAHYTQYRTYVDGNPDYPDSRAGSNESNKDDFIEQNGYDRWASLITEYVFPLGDSEDKPIDEYILKRGLLVEGASGSGPFNPLKSGKTTAKLEWFWRSPGYDFDEFNDFYYTNGLKFQTTYDNTDFYTNPSTGSRVRAAIARDFGMFNSTNTWTTLRADWSKYFSLGETEDIRQQVLAFNVWTAYTPTWNDDCTGPIEHRPPFEQGASLGGFYRMRGFADGRFIDKAAVYYGAEYRLIPDWNPTSDNRYLKFLDIDWFQLVGFGELGRVADTWGLKEFHNDMKWDAGFGIRGMFSKAVLRLDFAYSDEGVQVWAMVGHPWVFAL
ncbi:MAG: BamA/TamA family outer membrane protein [Bdellovibrionales bacterium]|nr:BamA/TamA family outer membrane protein [Bdellovibrionales bacterium]